MKFHVIRSVNDEMRKEMSREIKGLAVYNTNLPYEIYLYIHSTDFNLIKTNDQTLRFNYHIPKLPNPTKIIATVFHYFVAVQVNRKHKFAFLNSPKLKLFH